MPYFNTDGRLFRMVLNEDDPTVVDELSIVAQGLLAEQLTNPAPPATPAFNVIDPGVGCRARTTSISAAAASCSREDASNAKIWR